MSKFSLGVSLEEIEREIAKAMSACFKKNGQNSKEVYVCLKMIDKILPQNLPKMMNQVLNKHFLQLSSEKLRASQSWPIYKEIAAVKCIIDFRIAYYDMIGRDSSKYRSAALELHR